jgi:Cu(I)/Ag(I) efflux system protein CusF
MMFEKLFVAAAVAGAALLSTGAHATGAHGSAAGDMTAAEVRKVDKENNKITLKHEEIKNLQMPPMSMVFNVTDAKLLDNVKAGDKIHFRAVNEGGKFTVTEIHK